MKIIPDELKLRYVGKILRGYCNGYFGRDSYHKKTILQIGHRWVVVLENEFDPENECPNYAVFTNTEEMITYLDKWLEESKKLEEEDE